MQATTVGAIQARQNLGQLLEMAYYQNKQFQITRKDKPMARLVSENFMQALSDSIEQIVENDPTLADTLALYFDPELQKDIEEGKKEYLEGKAVALDKAFK